MMRVFLWLLTLDAVDLQEERMQMRKPDVDAEEDKWVSLAISTSWASIRSYEEMYLKLSTNWQSNYGLYYG